MPDVLVLGNAGVDLSISVPRLPRPGETLVGGRMARAPGGKGLNQAVVAARAGAAVHFLAAVGDDSEAAFVRAALAAEPFAALHLIALPMPTDLSVILVDPAGENSIVTAGDCADALSPERAATFGATARLGDVFVVQSNLSLASTLAGVAAARAQGGRILLNAAPLRWDVTALLPHCAVVVANAGEAAAITGLADPAAAAEALRQVGAALAIVTCGASGCVWADTAGCHASPAAAATAVDTTGAGDTFCGVLAAALASGAQTAASIEAAGRAAALTVSRRGAFAALPRWEELAWLATRAH